DGLTLHHPFLHDKGNPLSHGGLSQHGHLDGPLWDARTSHVPQVGVCDVIDTGERIPESLPRGIPDRRYPLVISPLVLLTEIVATDGVAILRAARDELGPTVISLDRG